MRDPSAKSRQKISKATRSVTSSPGSASGVTSLATLDGQMILPCGQEAVPAKVSVKAGRGSDSAIHVIYGLHGSGSSASYALTQSLASKYRAGTASRGSTLFSLNWKSRVTPAGRSIPALRASAHRTSGKESTSWPSASARDASSSKRHGYTIKGHPGTTLTDASNLLLSGWPTPKTPTGGAESGERKQELGRTTSGGGDLASVASWATPNSATGPHGPRGVAKNAKFQSGRDLEAQASWVTPAVRDYKGANSELHVKVKGRGRKHMDQLANQVAHSGPKQNGSIAATANTESFLLNPRFSLWLQGLPEEWACCAEQAIRSSLRKRKRSSRRT